MTHTRKSVVVDPRVDRQVLVSLKERNFVRLTKDVLFVLSGNTDSFEDTRFDIREVVDVREERIDRYTFVVKEIESANLVQSTRGNCQFQSYLSSSERRL